MHHAYSGYYVYLQVELQCNNPHFEKIIRCGENDAGRSKRRDHISERALYIVTNTLGNTLAGITAVFCFEGVKNEERAQGPLV